MREHTRNARLAAWMRDLGLTRTRLAEEVNRAITAADPHGPPPATTERWVYRLLAGQIHWPHSRQRDALEAVFGCSVLELGFLPPAGYRGTRRTLTLANAEDDMDRRRFLLVASSLGAVTIAVPDLGDATRVGMSDIDRLREPLRELSALDQRRGSHQLAPAAAEVVTELERILNNATMSGAVRRAAYGLQGEYLASAGWFSIDAADLDAAGRYLDRALTVAVMARDPMLQAQIWNVMAWRARESGKWGEVLAIAEAGLLGSAARRDPRVAAVMHDWAAHGHSGQGYRGSAERSIGRAREALDKVTGTEPTLWLGFLNHAEIESCAGSTSLRLGLYRDAEAAARRAMLATPANHARNRAGRTLRVAEARLGMREVEGAVEVATEALDQLSSVHSGRLLRRLQTLRDDFARWDEVPEAQEWVTRFDARSLA